MPFPLPRAAEADPTSIAPAPSTTLDIVVTMPAYHAAGTLEQTVRDLPSVLPFRVLVVDDASTDATVEVARTLGLDVVVHEQNRGYGGNQKTCYSTALSSGADIVVMLHPDYQYDPRAVPLLVAPILSGDADFTFGSRFAGMGDPRGGGMPWYRYYGNRLTTFVQNRLFGTNFSEHHSGMRAYTRRCLESLPFLGYSDDFDFDAQFLADAVTSGQRVVEVPIPTRYTKESSSIAIGASLRYVARSVQHAASARVRRGRLGHRSRLRRAGAPPRPLPSTGSVALSCLACGAETHRLVYPSNVAPDTPLDVDEFDCTSNVVAFHDDIVQCATCGVIRSDWNADPDEIVGNYAQTEDERYLEEEEGRRELFSWVLDQAERYAGRRERLLELGSHLGVFLSVAQQRGWSCRGVEPSAWAVAEGRRRFGVALEQGTVEGLEPPRDPYDLVVMLDMIEHVTDPLAALATARACVADDGLLVLTTIDIASRHARLRGASWPWMIRPHLWYFTPETLLGMLERSGFRAVDYREVPRDFHLSYVLDKGGDNLGAVGRLARPITRIVDPRIPTGLLGDIVCVVARPTA